MCGQSVRESTLRCELWCSTNKPAEHCQWHTHRQHTHTCTYSLLKSFSCPSNPFQLFELLSSKRHQFLKPGDQIQSASILCLMPATTTKNLPSATPKQLLCLSKLSYRNTTFCLHKQCCIMNT